MGSGMGGASIMPPYFLNSSIALNHSIFLPLILLKLALLFGADVPFFINGGKQYISGKQDQLTPLTVDT